MTNLNKMVIIKYQYVLQFRRELTNVDRELTNVGLTAIQ